MAQSLEPARELSYEAWLRETEVWLESSGFSEWLLAEDGSRRLQPSGTKVALVLQGCAPLHGHYEALTASTSAKHKAEVPATQVLRLYVEAGALVMQQVLGAVQEPETRGCGAMLELISRTATSKPWPGRV